MGLFSAKKKEVSDLKVPSPSKMGLSPVSFKGQNSYDDFGADPSRPRVPVPENPKMNALMPTTLAEAQKIDLSLPTFSTSANHTIDLDKIESELAIQNEQKKIEPQKSEENMIKITAPQMIKEKINENTVTEQINTQIQMHEPEAESEEKIMPEISDLDSDIPEEIEDIPDYIPGLDIDEDLFAIEHHKEDLEPKKAVFVSIASIKKINSESKILREKLQGNFDRVSHIDENVKKQKEFLQKSRNFYEDMERKILFVSKTLFSEE